MSAGRSRPSRRLWLGLGRPAILLLDLLVLLVIWQFVAGANTIPFLPPPTAILRVFLAELSGDLPGHFLISARRVLVSIAIGISIGAPLAILSANLPLLDRILAPLLYLAYPVPKVVFLPIMIWLVGLGDESKVTLISAIIIFQVYVIVRDAALRVPTQTLDSVASLGAGRAQILRYVYWPVSLPAVLTALKVSSGTAIAVLYIAEQTATFQGLGYYIKLHFINIQYEKVYVGVLAMSILGLLLFAALSALEARISRWQQAGREG